LNSRTTARNMRKTQNSAYPASRASPVRARSAALLLFICCLIDVHAEGSVCVGPPSQSTVQGVCVTVQAVAGVCV